MSKVLSDTYVASTIAEVKKFVMSKVLSDTYIASNVTDVINYTMSKTINDSYNTSAITESKSFATSKALSDVGIITDRNLNNAYTSGDYFADDYVFDSINFGFIFNKGIISDSVSVSETFTVVVN